MHQQPEITRLLQAHRTGDSAAFDRLIPLIYPHLRNLARAQLAGAPADRTLDTVALVNEAYMQLVGVTEVDWQNRQHFFSITARVMRRIVVDYARRHFADKRGGGQLPITLDPELLGAADQAEVVIAIHSALERLAPIEERLVRVVECRFFGGMTEVEIAGALDLSVSSVQRDWRRARAWLLKFLQT